MVAPAVEGIDLFKIAGRSISGWIPSLKTGKLRAWRHWSRVCHDLPTADPETRAIYDWLHI